jgi:hypothetical protein
MIHNGISGYSNGRWINMKRGEKKGRDWKSPFEVKQFTEIEGISHKIGKTELLCMEGLTG